MSQHSVNAFPAKRFFVEMLTRDIELQDAILDLLDNCVDGALRSNGGSSDGESPYKDYYARIKFDADSFCIEDNCGGIPQDLAESYAFRMGRPDPERDQDLPTVGVYGIGMKRAIFKMGHDSIVKSKTADTDFSVSIPHAWMDDDSNWALTLETGTSALSSPGTVILIRSLRDGVSRLFSDETDFVSTLKKAVSAYYGYIIAKGFSVFINDEKIDPIRVEFLTDENAMSSNSDAIAPFLYETEYKGVSVSLAVGLYAQIGINDEDDDEAPSRPSSDKAGWTIICNDRVVLYADKSRVTGWGDANVPQYHPQFVSIAGVVTFKSNDAKKLPVTTTKRGVEGNSEIYLAVKNIMRDGLKQFTDFTNRWKIRSPERAIAMRGADSSFLANEINQKIDDSRWTKSRNELGGKIFKPKLPKPKDTDPLRTVQFQRKESEIKEVRKFLFDDMGASISEVGSKCFDEALARSRK
ncbi:MAG: ATP-binding protein [Pseudomonadota bacterium]